MEIFPGNSNAVLSVKSGSLAGLRLGQKDFRLAAGQPTVAEAKLGGDFGPVRFELMADGPEGLRAAAIVTGKATGKTLEVEVGGRTSRVLSDGDLTVESGRLRIPLPAVNATFEALPGHVRATIATTAPRLEFADNGSVELYGAAEATAVVEFNLFWKTPEGPTIGIPIAVTDAVGAAVEAQFALRIDLKAIAEVRLYVWRKGDVFGGKLPILDEAAMWVTQELPAAVKGLQREIVGFAQRALLSGAKELTSVVEKITLLHPKVSMDAAGLSRIYSA